MPAIHNINPSGKTNLVHVVRKHGLYGRGLLVSVQLFHLSSDERCRGANMILATRLSQILFHLGTRRPFFHQLGHLSPNELHAHLALKNGLPLAGKLVQTKHFGTRSHPPYANWIKLHGHLVSIVYPIC